MSDNVSRRYILFTEVEIGGMKWLWIILKFQGLKNSYMDT